MTLTLYNTAFKGYGFEFGAFAVDTPPELTPSLIHRRMALRVMGHPMTTRGLLAIRRICCAYRLHSSFLGRWRRHRLSPFVVYQGGFVLLQ